MLDVCTSLTWNKETLLSRIDIKVDIKSVNNRYLDVQIKGPKSLLFLDDDLKKIITSSTKRGKVDVFIDIKSKGNYDMNLEIDYILLDLYKNNLNNLIEYLEIEKNRSQRTIANYDHYLTRLADYCELTEMPF